MSELILDAKGTTKNPFKIGAFSLTLSGSPTLGDWFDQAVKVASAPTFSSLIIDSGGGWPTNIDIILSKSTSGGDAGIFSSMSLAFQDAHAVVKSRITFYHNAYHSMGVELAFTTAAEALRITNGGLLNIKQVNSLGLLDTNASHYLRLNAGSDLSADRILSFVTGDAARTITLSGNPTLNDWFDQSVKQAATPTFGGMIIANGGTVGQAAGPLLTFDDTGNILTVGNATTNFNAKTTTGRVNVANFGTAGGADGSVYIGIGSSVLSRSLILESNSWSAGPFTYGNFGDGIISVGYATDGDYSSLRFFAPITGGTMTERWKIQGSATAVTYCYDTLNIAGPGIVIANGGTIGQAAGPLLTFNDTDNYLGITGTNVGIGTVSPGTPLDIYVNSAAVVDILTLRNNQATSAGVRVLMNNGYGNLGAIKVSQLDNGGLADDGVMELQTASNSALSTKLTILNSGYVGIGTTTPGNTLEVNGIIAVNNATGYIKSGSTGLDKSVIIGAVSTYAYIQSANYAQDGGTTILSLNPSGGNVGIGTTGPLQKVHIDTGATGSNQGIPATSGTTQNGILRLSPGTVSYGESFDFGMNISTTYAWIQVTNRANLSVNYNLALNPNGGNVGIGTTTPLSKLHIKMPTGDVITDNSIVIESDLLGRTLGTAGSIGWMSNLGSNYFVGKIAVTSEVGGYGLSFSTWGPAALHNSMYIDQSGNVGIGTTAPLASLHIAGGERTTLILDKTGGSTTKRFKLWVSSADENYIESLNTGLHFMAGAAGTTEIVTFLVGGNVGIGTTAPAAKLAINGGLHVGGDTDPGDNNLLVDGTAEVTGDIFTTSWTDYSGTSTVNGWAAGKTVQIYYKKVGKLVFVQFYITGTSDSVGANFTVPVSAQSTIYSYALCPIIFTNNSVASTTPGKAHLVNVAGAFNIVSLYPDFQTALWTNSGTKTVAGQFWYHTA